MTTPKKKTAAAPKAARPSKPQARVIRNLRNCPVHLRLQGPDTEKPYRVQLNPRGQFGDVTRIPAALTETYQFTSGVGTLFEIITQTEASAIPYAPTGYIDQAEVTVVRTEEQVVSRRAEYDGKGRVPAHRPLAPTVAQVPGSDPRMQALSGEKPTADAMIPEGVDLTTRKVTIERVKE